MWRIADVEPQAKTPGGGVIEHPCAHLIFAIVVAQAYLDHGWCISSNAAEEVVGIAVCHRDRIRVKVEAGAVARLGSRSTIDDGKIVVVIDFCEQAEATH